jgi:hypothetical protein
MFWLASMKTLIYSKIQKYCGIQRAAYDSKMVPDSALGRENNSEAAYDI